MNITFQGPLIAFQSPQLGADDSTLISPRAQLTVGVLGIALLVGTGIWLARGGAERLPLRKTRYWDYT